jgi:hypothetical protein
MLMVGLTTIFTHPLLQHVTDIYLGWIMSNHRVPWFIGLV